MTNAQIKVPLTPMLKVVFANKDQLKKAAKSNPGSLNNLGTWNPGTSARAVIALLKLTSILCKISNDYGDQVQEQIKASTTIAKATGQAQINAGEAQYNEALTQGIIGAVSGGLSAIGTIAMGVRGFNSNEIEGLENEEQGLQSYSERLQSEIDLGENAGVTELNPEQETQLQKHLDAIEEKSSEELRKMGKTKKEFLKKNPQSNKEQISVKNEELIQEQTSFENSEFENDAKAIKDASREQKIALKKAIDERLENAQKEKQRLMNDSSSKMQSTNTVIQGAQSAMTGVGSAASAGFKQQQAKYQKDQTLDQNAEGLINGILSSNRNDEDKYFQNATDVNQVINAIRQANQIN